MQRLIFLLCVCVCACVHYITLDYCEVRIIKTFEFFTTHIILYFIPFTMKIARELNHDH